MTIKPLFKTNKGLMASCCSFAVIIGIALCAVGISADRGSITSRVAYILNKPALDIGQSFLVFINRADAFPLLLPFLVLHWLCLGALLGVLIIAYKRVCRGKENYAQHRHRH